MPAGNEILQFLQVVILLGFIGVTSMFLMLTVVNRHRVDGVVLEFPTGQLFGFPLKPLVFALLVTALFVAGIFRDFAMSPVSWLGYLVGAMFWGGAAFVGTSVLVTENELIKNLGSPRGSIAWGQVEDYFDRRSAGGRRFTFFYRDDQNRRCRFDVHVPSVYVQEFAETVDDILERKFRVRRMQRRSRERLEDL